MKKFFLFLLIFTAAVLYGYSQSLSLSNASGAITANSTIVQAGSPDSVELITYLNVTNNSGNAIDVLCKKVEISMLDSTEVTICWGGGCYPATTFVSPEHSTIGAGQTNTEFVGHYTQIAFNHFKPGESIVRWVFYNRANTDDSVSVTVKYTSFPMGVRPAEETAAGISAFFPNPAPREATCTYALPAGKTGQIVVRDIVGSSIARLDLEAGNGKASFSTLGLSDGIYFCTLLVDGKAVQTRKVIVRH